MRQKLGQHFLKNEQTLSFIARNSNIKQNDFVIEIGSGHGELTKYLILETKKNNARLLCIEKDPTFFTPIKILIGKNNELLKGDVREILPLINRKLGGHPYVIIGNIPYYLTSFLFRIISELETKPHTITLLIQKEVAERIKEKPPKQNLLSAIIASFADAKIVKRVSRGQFSPPPKVDSAVVQLTTHNRYTQKEIDIYIKTAKILFSQPRKTIFNNARCHKEEIQLSESTIRDIFFAAKVKESDRAQALTPKTMMVLAKMLYNEM
ncbi:MAG: rRNA adenine dimethyltransferase family protein [Candidatus Paceibacterota bacterium]|jgi:16S rRNA (adenine1518-N6/adenine1519-N6)-dimethyltransferase